MVPLPQTFDGLRLWRASLLYPPCSSTFNKLVLLPFVVMHLWYLILCQPDWLRDAQNSWWNRVSGASLSVFTEEISIWMRRLCKGDHPLIWADSIQTVEGTRRTKNKWRNYEFCLSFLELGCPSFLPLDIESSWFAGPFIDDYSTE